METIASFFYRREFFIIFFTFINSFEVNLWRQTSIFRDILSLLLERQGHIFSSDYISVPYILITWLDLHKMYSIICSIIPLTLAFLWIGNYGKYRITFMSCVSSSSSLGSAYKKLWNPCPTNLCRSISLVFNVHIKYYIMNRQ